MTIQELIAYLKMKRGIAAEVVIEASTDGRAYGRFVEEGVPWPKETTFAIRPNGTVFDLAFFKTYQGTVNKACDAAIFANLPHPERRAMGYGPADVKPVDNGGHAGYVKIIDDLDARLRAGGATPVVEPASSHKRAPDPSQAAPRLMSMRSQTAPIAVRDFFETEAGQLRALEACRDFLDAKDWPLTDRLRLYEYSRHAFGVAVPTSHCYASFHRIYDELVRPARAGGWGVARNPAGPLWASERAFETIKREFAGFTSGGPVTLANIDSDETKQALVLSLGALKGLKPLTGSSYPVMAVSKFLHAYNPELFPIYDNEVIAGMVIHRFKDEFRAFCVASSLSHQVGNSVDFYVSYILWGCSLLRVANRRFMDIFVDWFEKQPAVNSVRGSFNTSRLYSVAFELTIIGAYQDSLTTL